VNVPRGQSAVFFAFSSRVVTLFVTPGPHSMGVGRHLPPKPAPGVAWSVVVTTQTSTLHVARDFRRSSGHSPGRTRTDKRNGRGTERSKRERREKMTRSKRTTTTPTTPRKRNSPNPLQSRTLTHYDVGRRNSARGFRARGRKGHGLASARDRSRLREADLAERARVEKMLSTVAIPDDRRSDDRDSNAEHETRGLDFESRAHHFPNPDPNPNQSTSLWPRHCPVCGDARIVTDEVLHGGTLSMSECLHCDHRWTERPKARWVELGTRMNGRGRRRTAATAATA